MSKRINFKDLISNQFFLLIVGAVISSLLIPWFFQIWQNQQTELEIKTSLISKISESVIDLIMTTQSVILQNNYQQINTQTEINRLFDNLNEKYRQWEIESAIINSQLRAYFPNSDVSNLWGSLKIYSNSFSENVTDFYRLSNNAKVNSTSPIDFGEKRQAILDQMESIIDKILKAKITSFSIGFGETRQILLDQMESIKDKIQEHLPS